MTALIEETFYQELLTKPLSQYPMQISFPTLQQNPAQLVERIEAIVCVLEKLDSDGGAQHDFL